MTDKEMIKGIVLNGEVTLSFIEVCDRYHISKQMLMDWMEHGLLGESHTMPDENTPLNDMMINRILTAYRLQHDLEVNLQGVILALELLDEVTKLQDELMIYKRLISDNES